MSLDPIVGQEPYAGDEDLRGRSPALGVYTPPEMPEPVDNGLRDPLRFGDKWVFIPNRKPLPLWAQNVPSREFSNRFDFDPMFKVQYPEELVAEQFARDRDLALAGGTFTPTLPPMLAPAPEGTDERPPPAPPEERRKQFGDATIKQLSEGYYYTPDGDAYPNPYFLELYEDYASNPAAPPVDAVSLRYINSVTKQAPVALVRTRGMDGSVYQENEGFMQATFTLNGRSGDSAVDLVRFQKMRNFLAKYAEESKKHKNALVRGKDVQLVLYFPFEAEAYKCDVLSFDYKRAAGDTTNSFNYTLTLITNGVVGNKWKLPETANALAKLVSSYDNNHKNPRHPCVVLKEEEERRRPPGDPTGGAAGDPPDIGGPTRDAQESPETGCADVAAGTTSIMRFNLWADGMPLVQAQAAFESYFYTLLHASDMANAGIVASGSRFDPCISPAYTLESFLLNIDLYSRRTNIRSNMAPTTVPGLPIPTEVYTCTQGRTNCYDIAEDVYGDRSRADELIDYNSFLDAYTRGDGSPLDVGDTLMVPRPTGVISRTGDVFGTDLRLVDGDLVPVGATDIAVVSGYDCYSQNLHHRMQTVQGTNKTYPRYGLKPYVGQVTTSDVPGDLRANVRSQLQSDHRTDRVVSIEVIEQGDKATVNAIVQPVGISPSQVTFTYNLEA